jgi:hypothetical protein
MTLWELAKKVNDAGGGIVAIVALLSIGWAVAKRIIRLGREYDEMVTQRDFWRERALRSTDLVERNNATTNRALSMTEKAIETAEKAGPR